MSNFQWKSDEEVTARHNSEYSQDGLRLATMEPRAEAPPSVFPCLIKFKCFRHWLQMTLTALADLSVPLVAGSAAALVAGFQGGVILFFSLPVAGNLHRPKRLGCHRAEHRHHPHRAPFLFGVGNVLCNEERGRDHAHMDKMSRRTERRAGMVEGLTARRSVVPFYARRGLMMMGSATLRRFRIAHSAIP
jgi:hypothetical protein